VLFRSRYVAYVLLLPVLAEVLTAFQNFVLSDGLEVMGDVVSLGFTALIFLASLGLYWYARSMTKVGVLF